MKTFFSVFSAIICAATVIAIALWIKGSIDESDRIGKETRETQRYLESLHPPKSNPTVGSQAATPASADQTPAPDIVVAPHAPKPLPSTPGGVIKYLRTQKTIPLKYGTFTIPGNARITVADMSGPTYRATYHEMTFSVLPSEVTDDETEFPAPPIPVQARPPIATAAPTAPIAAISPSDIMPFDNLGRDNISVRVKQVAWGTTVKTDYEDSLGSYDRDTKAHKLIEVELSPVGNDHSPAVIEFYYVIREHGGDYKFMMHSSKQSPDGTGKFPFDQTVKRSDSWDAYWREQYKSGNKVAGWLVRVVRNNRIVAVAASADQYKAYAENPAKLASSMKIKEQRDGFLPR